MRIHVVLSREVVESGHRVVGRRCRSKFFTEAVQEKLARLRLVEAARWAIGSLADVDIPGWETRESAAEWVRGARQAGDARMNGSEISRRFDE